MLKIEAVSSRASLARRVASCVVGRCGALLMLGILAACGGGGGGGGGSPSSGGTAPLVYTGNANAAVITTANAADIVEAVTGGDDASNAISGSASVTGTVEGGNARDLGRRIGRSVMGTVLRPATGSSQQSFVINVNDPLTCESGSGVISGTLNDNLTGTAAISWNGCRNGDTTLTGSGSITIQLLDGFPADFTITFTRLTVAVPTRSVDVSGSVRLQVSIPNNRETLTSNYVARASTGAQGKVENLVQTAVFNNISSPFSPYTERISGRLYDGEQGFVDIVTDAPLVFDSPTQAFPRSGQITVTGANKARIRVTAFSATAVALGLDVNGDGVFELAASLAWNELSSPAAADLSDDDGDGIHNSWETTRNFDPLNPADALEDPDGDTFNNLAEYRAATNPRDRFSTPFVLGVPSQITVPPLVVTAGSTPVLPLPAPAAEGAAPTPISARVINLPGVSDLLFHPGRARLYAAVRGIGTAGTIVPINPVTGDTEAAIMVGINPNKLALSDDGQFLYVGFQNDSAFQRIRLATGAVERFALGSQLNCGDLFVEDMQVVPGSPGSVAISRMTGINCSSNHEGVAIYDHGVQRVARTDSNTGSNLIQFASANTLYGYNTRTTEFGLRTMVVDALGVAVTRINSFAGLDLGGIRFADVAGGRLYTRSGHVIDPAVPALLAHYGVSIVGGGLVLPDGALGRVFFLSFESGVWSLRAFDMTSIPPVRLGREDISNVVGQPGGLIRWGNGGLAFHTGGLSVRTGTEQILLIDSRVLIP